MNVVTSYFSVRILQGALAMGSVANTTMELDQQKQLRNEEYLSCITRNTDLGLAPVIKREHLLVQDPESYRALQQASVTCRRSHPQSWLAGRLSASLFSGSPHQPLYRDFFVYCNGVLSGQMCMVCNSDIYLSQGPEHLWPMQDLESFFQTHPNTVFALSRYENEMTLDCPLIDEYRGSHDAFVFKSPLRHSFVESVAHKQNCFQSENIVIHELRAAGYDVVNPCKTLKIFHQHECDIRQWYPSVDEGRYGRAEPCTLGDVFAKYHL
jgi:hypothetical protein